MTRSLRLPLIMALPVLLAACGDSEVSTEDDEREASGEVLEGTISDAMLPVDEVRSQAPLRAPDPAAPASAESDATGGEDGEAAPEDTAAPASAEVAEAPAE